ncbi:esterase/lipase superfamily enzyme [Pseudorhizobium tarimense]|uniref:Esterase/lipase superfamily enzyme n=1 Tax=Pseudorhizobium tarimense TaxID=1079109 RepID=A0ABV2H290_9HYPH|nr:alpha/beta hydrolase [Pseudorhizobium tarimense]MCJ8517741.1 alpha/beta hydrolase [Pseudorhizobium tarimense]
MITGAAHSSRRLRAAFLPLLLALSLSGCAGRPEGVLIPTASAAAPGEEVDIFVATTRQPSRDPGILFSGERGQDLEATAITVSIPPDANREIGEVQWPKRLPADPATEFATVRVEPVQTEKGANRWLSKHLPPSKRVLVFVHGFNNRYEEAVYRFAQIVHDSNAEAAPVLFTWPSRASIFDYNYDKESANYSRDGLERVLDQIADDPQVADVVVLAHSMGSWLTVEALRQMAIREGRVEPKIRNVILASPDLDVDVFGQQLETIGEDGPHFTLFVSRDDRALQLSRRISGSIDRLGQIDPTVEPYRSEFEKAGITVLDLTALESGDPLNHGKFAQSPQVVQLIGSRLLAGQEITTGGVALGDRLGAIALGTAQTVGGVASATVSAPIAVFDPDTRRTYGEQINRVGRSIENTIVSTVAQ